ncbi:MAG TPA: hypothetical protein VFO61_05455 [Alphaproteobacteria bacterium]|nr:hypothetical protein [Alphaproteobacteria bacterium]
MSEAKGAGRMGAGVSRWTMAHFAGAVASLVAAEVLMASGAAFPGADLGAPLTLIAVHLVTIGWLGLLVFGALYQFVPVLVAKPLFSQRLALVSLVLVGLGLAGMIVGFAALSGGGALVHALGLGGLLVVSGFAVAIVNLAATLVRGRPLAMPARFVAAGLGCLALTGLLGLAFACAIAAPPWAPSRASQWLSAILARGLTAHVTLGLGGWFTLVAMGVSYRLLSMFMLAPEAKARFAPWVLGAALLGLAAVFVGVFVAPEAAATGGGLEEGGFVLLGLAVALYVADVVTLYRARVRRNIELNAKASAVAVALLGLATVAFAAAHAFGADDPAITGAVALLFAFGWLSGLALAQLFKIVPFLTWLERFAPKIGKGPQPRVQDLVDERRAAPWYVGYFAAVLTAAGATAVEAPTVAQAALAVQAVATVLIAGEFLRARRSDGTTRKPEPPRTVVPFPKPRTAKPQTEGDPHGHRTAHS